MGKVLWHVTMSLDGCIASSDGDMSWMAAYAPDVGSLDEILIPDPGRSDARSVRPLLGAG